MIKSGLLALSLFPLMIGAEALAQTAPPQPQSDFPDHISGDLGLGVFNTPRNYLGKSSQTSVLPYAYFDYQRLFARLDTFGVKTFKIGDGYLELAGRVNVDGIDARNGINKRSNSVPLGIGTFQETPFGAFFLNAFYDVNKSHGTLLEAIYAAEFKLGPVTFYPQAGVERRSSSYNNYFYGVTPIESAASGYRAYQAGASTNPILSLSLETPLSEHLVANLTFKRKWLGSTVSDSPIVNRRTEDTAFITVSYRFK